MNLATVVTGPAPKIRVSSRPRQWLLVVWAAGLVYVFGDMSRLAVALAAYPMVAWAKTGAIVAPGLATTLAALIGWVAIVAILGLVVWRITSVPGKICRELAEYRTRFPVQSLQEGRWMRLPFVRWGVLYEVVGIAAAAVGAFFGMAYGIGRYEWLLAAALK